MRRAEQGFHFLGTKASFLGSKASFPSEAELDLCSDFSVFLRTVTWTQTMVRVLGYVLAVDH